MFLLIFLLLAQGPSIHQIEYESHLEGAVFTEVSQTPFVFVPLRVDLREMLKDYYGYCPYWTDTIYYNYFQMDLLTHIAYFSVEIDPNNGSLGSIPNLSRFTKIRDHGHAHGVRIHMTCTLFGSSSVTAFLNNAAARQNAITGISNFMTNYGIEGANIDFEFVTGSVRDSFNLFINDLSIELWNHAGDRKDVYIASIAVPEWYPGYDIDYLADHCDGLFIMAYDFHWSGSSTAGPVSPCVPSSFWGQYCAAKSIGSYKAYGVDGSKIVLGIPYYGLDWPTVGPDMGSATTGTAAAKIYYYAFQDANTYGRLWDDYSLTPWYRYQSTEWHQCWYDDSVSLDIKFGMVNDSILEGAGCWALGYDRSYDHIWNAVRKNFWDPQAIVEAENTPRMEPSTASIFSGVLKLSGLFLDQEYHIIIYDVSGRKINERIQRGIVQLEIGKDLRAGIYFLCIFSDNSFIKAKIIKIR
jgi:spore germination protein YaaH